MKASASKLEDFRYSNWVKRFHRIVQIVLLTTFIGGLNYLSAKHFWRIDLTHRHLYSLSPETLAYLRQIDRLVTIFVTITPDSREQQMKQLYRYVRNLLKEYEYAAKASDGDKIKVEFINIYRERQKAEYLARTYGLEQPELVLMVCENRQRIILPTDIIKLKEGRVETFTGEQAVTSALLDVANAIQQKVYFLIGHGEMRFTDVDPLRGLSELALAMEQRNLALAFLDLTQVDEVPADADLVMLISPQGPLHAHEVEKLRNYLLERAGRLIAMIDPWRKHGLNDLLFEWSITADDMLILDTGRDFQKTSGDLLIRQFAAHPITDVLLKNQIPIAMGATRPVRRDLGAPLDERLTTQPLMGSSPTSWAEKAYRQIRQIKELQFDPKVDLKGPVPIAAVSERKVSSQLGISISGGRLVVFGNSDMIANQQISSIGNYMLIFNTINWCLNRDQMLAIPPRPAEKLQIPLSRQDINQLALILLILPGIVTLLGITIYWVRKH